MKAQITDHHRRFRNSISSDDQPQGHDQPLSDTALTHIQERSASASRVQNKVHVIPSTPEPDDGQETPYQRARRHERKQRVPWASAASAVWDGDNDKRPNSSESDDETRDLFPFTKLTSSPALLSTKYKSPSLLRVNDERGSSPLVDGEARMLEPEPSQSHNESSSISSAANRTKPSKNNVTEPENLSPTLTSDTPVENSVKPALEPKNLVNHDNESQAPADEILPIPNMITPHVIAPDTVSKSTIFAPKNADSATKASSIEDSPFLASDIQGKDPQAALHTPEDIVDQISVVSKSAPHSQSSQRGIISWRPTFLKSKKKKMADVTEINSQPLSVKTNRSVAYIHSVPLTVPEKPFMNVAIRKSP